MTQEIFLKIVNLLKDFICIDWWKERWFRSFITQRRQMNRLN